MRRRDLNLILRLELTLDFNIKSFLTQKRLIELIFEIFNFWMILTARKARVGERTLTLIMKPAIMLIFTILLACNYSFNNYSPSSNSSPAPSPSTLTLNTSDLVIETPTTAELSASIFQLKATGTAEYGCTYDSAGSNTSTTGTNLINADPFTSTSDRTGLVLTAPSAMNIVGVKMRVKKSSGPTGSITVDVDGVSGGLPTATVLTDSSSTDLATLNTASSGNIVTFSLTTSQNIVSGQSIALLLKPSVGAILNGINNFGLLSTDDATGTACSIFSIYKRWNGSAWVDSNNAGYRRGYFTLIATTYAYSGSGYWAIPSPSGSATTWDLSSFTSTENPNAMGGSFTYDLGVGSDSTPSFSLMGLTKTQVQESADLTGAYLFIRVNITNSSPHFERAEISGASISTL